MSLSGDAINFAKCFELRTWWSLFSVNSLRIRANSFDKLLVREPVKDTMGRRRIFPLCSFGRPYNTSARLLELLSPLEFLKLSS